MTVAIELLRRSHSAISDALVDARRAATGLDPIDRDDVLILTERVEAAAVQLALIANELDTNRGDRP